MDRFREKLLEALEDADVWLDFNSGSFITDTEVREMIRTGKLSTDNVSSRPDVFPVVSTNMKAAVRALHKVTSLDQDDAEVVEYECHNGVVGFKNPGNSCFMDSTLMAMFFLQNSPFYDGIFNSTFDPKTMSCSKDPDENAQIKQDLRDLMKADVDRILKGEVGYKCVELRKLIGKTCRGGGEDMSVDEHDAGEFYMRLLDIMNYTPMIIRETRFYPDHPEEGETEARMPENWLNVGTSKGKPHISWPDFWSPQSVINEGHDHKNGWLHETVINIVSADVIVVHVNRRSGAAPAKIIKGKAQNVKIVYNTDPIEFDHEMNVTFTSGEKRIYVLLAAVYAPYQGHYASLLKCDGNWHVYDDVKATKPYENNHLSDIDAEMILSTKATMLFYY